MTRDIKEYNKIYKRKQRANPNSNAYRVNKPKLTDDDKALIYEKRKETMRLNNRKLRLSVLQHYSHIIPFCACCGEKELKFMALDHKNNNGAEHRREIGGINRGGNMFFWAAKNNFPPIFQVLCHNCNMAKGLYGECPHKQLDINN
jgi:hypothetical protein